MPSLSSCWSYKYTGETEVRTKGAVSLPFVLKRSRITLYRQPYGSSAAQMEDMDALAKARFGGLKPKQRLIVKEKKCFDSADWALAKEGKKQPDSIPTAPVGAVPEVQHHPKHAGSNLKPNN